jgi:hypothetical protein
MNDILVFAYPFVGALATYKYFKVTGTTFTRLGWTTLILLGALFGYVSLVALFFLHIARLIERTGFWDWLTSEPGR